MRHAFKLSTLSVLMIMGAARADLIRVFDDTGSAPTASFDYPASAGSFTLTEDLALGAGRVVKKTFNLTGSYASAGMAFCFKDCANGGIDARSVTSISVWLKTDISRSITIGLRPRADDLLYNDTLANAGINYQYLASVEPAGTKVVLTKSDFAFPGWSSTNADLLRWLDSDAEDPAKHIDTLLSTLRFIQFGYTCTPSCADDIGFIEIDSLIVHGVTIDGESWQDGATGVLSGASRHATRLSVIGQFLTVDLPATEKAKLVLVGQDGSRIADWNVSGSQRVALPGSLKQGTFLAILSSKGGQAAIPVSIIK